MPTSQERALHFIAQGEIVTPTDVEQELIRLVERLEQASAFIRAKVLELAEVENAYVLARARALVEATARTVEQRNAQALLTVEETTKNPEWGGGLVTRRTHLEAIVRASREGAHNIRSEIEAVRSLGASARSAMGNTLGQGGPNERSRY